MPSDDHRDDLLGEFDDAHVPFRYFWEHGFVIGFFVGIALGAALELSVPWLYH
jgi:hypothetical protein